MYRPPYGYLLFWFAFNLTVACCTELYSDEAYYWMYAQYLDFGYFDHPPGVALLIWMTSWLGKTEFAVRLLMVTLTTLSVAVLHKLTQPRHQFTFFLTVFSFLSLHILGFVALPDVPFFFFAILFMAAYKKILIRVTPWHVIALGMTMAAMLYSKYHGILVIGFVILSNMKLLMIKSFWVSAVLALFLFLPHLWWQWAHNFPSWHYHLNDRNVGVYQWKYTLEYVAGNLAFHGGLVSILFFIISFFYKTTNRWEHALKWNLYGTLTFFFFVTFSGQRIEPNWTIFCIVPLVCLGYRYIEQSKWRRAYHRMAIVSAILMMVFKIHLMYPFFVWAKDRVWDFHLNKAYIQQIDAAIGNRILAANTYQDASLINFYGSHDYRVTALNIQSRLNQYMIWEFDSMLCGVDVAYVNNHLSQDVVVDKKYDEQAITFLDNVTAPGWIQIRHIDAEIKNGLANVSIDVKLRYRRSCVIDRPMLFEIKWWRDDILVSRHEEFFYVSSKGDSTYQYTHTATPNINRVTIAVGSSQLGVEGRRVEQHVVLAE